MMHLRRAASPARSQMEWILHLRRAARWMHLQPDKQLVLLMIGAQPDKQLVLLMIGAQPDKQLVLLMIGAQPDRPVSVS
jgi:hypothetical protein